MRCVRERGERERERDSECVCVRERRERGNEVRKIEGCFYETRS